MKVRSNTRFSDLPTNPLHLWQSRSSVALVTSPPVPMVTQASGRLVFWASQPHAVLGRKTLGRPAAGHRLGGQLATVLSRGCGASVGAFGREARGGRQRGGPGRRWKWRRNISEGHVSPPQLRQAEQAFPASLLSQKPTAFPEEILRNLFCKNSCRLSVDKNFS